jgi:YbbR domain-containing protein
MVHSVRHNVGWAILALLLSAVLWVVITGEQNPPKVDVYPRPIPVEMVNTPANMGVLGEVQFVRVRISALPEVWARLEVSDFRATADLSKAKSGSQEVGVRVTTTDPQVQVLEVVPPKVTVRVEPLLSREVPVRVNLQGSVPLGFSIGDPKVSPSQVVVRGPAPLVKLVAAAAADISLEGVRVSINQTLKLTPRSASGSRIEGVTLEPSAVEVQLPVEQQIQYRSVSLVPTVSGSVAPGYWISSLLVEPSTVTVAGSRETLQQLNFIATRPADVSGATADLTSMVEIDLPQGVSLIEPRSPQVVVRVYVSPIQGTRSFSLTPSLEGLSPGLEASTGRVQVLVSGPLPLLREMKPTSITVTLSLDNLEPGVHVLTPKVKAPEGVKVEQVNPEQVTVTVSKRE